MATGPLDDDDARPPGAFPRLDEPFDGPGFSAWAADTHPLGRGSVRAENVALGGGVASLSLSAGAYDGAEIRSAARYGPGAFRARMRTPHAPGSISAFFLYEGVPGGNDEIDIEIFNDGTRRVMLTTWVAGRETGSHVHTLPFDPAAAFHDYRIEWSAGRVRFCVDGAVVRTVDDGVPASPMYVMANTWWPTWLTGPRLSVPRTMEIEGIQAGG